MNTNTLLPLELLQPGDWADVADVSGDAGCVGRLGELGIRVGCRLQVVQPGSPCLVRIGHAAICLRGDCAVQILVQPLAEN